MATSKFIKKIASESGLSVPQVTQIMKAQAKAMQALLLSEGSLVIPGVATVTLQALSARTNQAKRLSAKFQTSFMNDLGLCVKTSLGSPKSRGIPNILEAIQIIIGNQALTVDEIYQEMKARSWVPNSDDPVGYIGYTLSSKRTLFVRDSIKDHNRVGTYRLSPESPHYRKQ